MSGSYLSAVEDRFSGHPGEDFALGAVRHPSETERTGYLVEVLPEKETPDDNDPAGYDQVDSTCPQERRRHPFRLLDRVRDSPPHESVAESRRQGQV